MIATFEQYYDELKKAFHKLFYEMLYDCQPETIHQFRLNLKRQLGFFRLLEILQPDFQADESFSGFSSLYKMAGKVRDVQVEKSVVLQDEKELLMKKSFSKWLTDKEIYFQQELRQMGALASLAPIHTVEVEVSERLRKMTPELLEHKLPAYFKHRISSLKRQLKKQKRISLHDLRRGVKELYYNLQLLQRLSGKKALPKPTLNALDRWQELLGRWHDYDFILSRIRTKKEPCPGVVRKQYQTRLSFFVKEISRQSPRLAKLLDQIQRDLKDFWPNLTVVQESGRIVDLKGSFQQKNMREGYL